jgi:superfamily II DNA/RNA helicase
MEPHPIVKDIDHCEPQVIIMAPTRELAVQIKSVVLKLSRGTMISSLVCYGGTLVSHQKNQILVSKITYLFKTNNLNCVKLLLYNLLVINILILKCF